MTFYKRIDPAFTSQHINEKILVLGEIKEIYDKRVKIDTLSNKIDVNLKNHDEEIKVGDHIEIRGELVGDNFIMADHFTVVNDKFELDFYNKVCKKLFAVNYK